MCAGRCFLASIDKEIGGVEEERVGSPVVLPSGEKSVDE